MLGSRCESRRERSIASRCGDGRETLEHVARARVGDRVRKRERLDEQFTRFVRPVLVERDPGERNRGAPGLTPVADLARQLERARRGLARSRARAVSPSECSVSARFMSDSDIQARSPIPARTR